MRSRLSGLMPMSSDAVRLIEKGIPLGNASSVALIRSVVAAGTRIGSRSVICASRAIVPIIPVCRSIGVGNRLELESLGAGTVAVIDNLAIDADLRVVRAACIDINDIINRDGQSLPGCRCLVVQLLAGTASLPHLEPSLTGKFQIQGHIPGNLVIIHLARLVIKRNRSRRRCWSRRRCRGNIRSRGRRNTRAARAGSPETFRTWSRGRQRRSVRYRSLAAAINNEDPNKDHNQAKKGPHKKRKTKLAETLGGVSASWKPYAAAATPVAGSADKSAARMEARACNS